MSMRTGTLRCSLHLTLRTGMVALLVLGFLAAQPPSLLATTLKHQTCTSSSDAIASFACGGTGGPVSKPQNCDYYSDASYSVWVGHAYLDCYGRIVEKSGTLTAYRICEYDLCCCYPDFGWVWC